MGAVETKREEIEKRRTERRAALAQDKEEQALIDLEAYDTLEVEHGDGNVASLEVERFVKGQPTIVVFRAPSGIQYKRFADQVGKAQEKNDVGARRKAQDLLAESCWVYPAEPEARKSMLEEFPGLLISIAIHAAKLVEANRAEEGKG